MTSISCAPSHLAAAKALVRQSDDTARIYNKFQARKREAQARVSGLRKAVSPEKDSQ
jgi:hypothetical protein